MIELEGIINNQPISIWIDSGTKRKVSELVKYHAIDTKGASTKAFLNVIPLGSYDCSTGMDWLDKHRVVLDCYDNTFTCLDGEGSHKIVQGVPRPIAVREISALQLKKSLEKHAKFLQSTWKKQQRMKSQIWRTIQS